MEDNRLLDAWLEQEKIHRFEGDSGLKDLERVVETLGYRGHGFKFGSPIEHFLSDNPGACDAIVEFIRDWVPRSPEWADNLRDELDEESEEDDDVEA